MEKLITHEIRADPPLPSHNAACGKAVDNSILSTDGRLRPEPPNSPGLLYARRRYVPAPVIGGAVVQLLPAVNHDAVTPILGVGDLPRRQFHGG